MASSKKNTEKPEIATKDVSQPGHEKPLGKKAGRLDLDDGARESEHEFIT